MFGWFAQLLINLLRWFGVSIISGFGKLMTNFWAGLLFFLPAIVYKVLIGLGVGTVTYVLGDFALDLVYQQIESQLTGLPADMLSLVKMSGFPEALSILFGALSARVTYSALGVNKKTMTWNA
jgi:uncharacterized membrane protein